jgi:large subunit ribosomal protein L31
MSGAEFVATSTLKSEETKKIDGVEHFVINIETSSASHPFYTGKRRNDVRNDQVAKFMARVAKAQDKNKPKEIAPEEFDKEVKAVAKKATAKKANK